MERNDKLNPRRGTSGDSPKNTKPRVFRVEEETALLPFLIRVLSDKSRSTVKSILANRQVEVNGRVTTQFNAPLRPGDELTIRMEKASMAFHHPDVEILYEDRDLIVINKKQGLLSVATNSVKDKTAYHILSDYVKGADPRNRIFVLHRLDRETSGVMMFAKNPGVQEQLQEHWNEMVLERKYVAVVEGRPKKERDRISSYLQENKAMNVYSAAQGQLAITNYVLLKSNRQYSLLELELETGRKNQIRIHLAEMGHPVAGDTKYGAQSNPIHRLALHAHQLKFIHPTTRQVMDFQTEIPKRFALLVKQRSRPSS